MRSLRNIANSTIFCLISIGTSIIIGLLIWKLRLFIFSNSSKYRVYGVNRIYYRILFTTGDMNYYHFLYILDFINQFILGFSFLLLIFYSILKGSNKRFLFIEYTLAFIFNMFMVTGPILFLG